MQTNYPELRAWLQQQEGFPTYIGKSPYLCTIQDNQALGAVQMLEANSMIRPSVIIVVMPDGTYKDFWQDCADNEQNIPYDIRLPSYSASFIVF
jgi:hypothetical protein